ncbi:MAG: hypothetical protein KatS3mg051_0299 [Anaerolineae bacterium]|nr:MAG: hypothetical protein KatS3mg051_0299 [Anaerolineae bacterium]
MCERTGYFRTLDAMDKEEKRMNRRVAGVIVLLVGLVLVVAGLVLMLVIVAGHETVSPMT